MSVAVELAELAERIRSFGPIAYLVTVNSDGAPHVVSARIGWADGQREDGHSEDAQRLAAPVGSRTLANVEQRPHVTCLWPAIPGTGYSLIVDGRAVAVPEDTETNLYFVPEAAVLHRTPDGDPAEPSCIRLLTRD